MNVKFEVEFYKLQSADLIRGGDWLKNGDVFSPYVGRHFIGLTMNDVSLKEAYSGYEFYRPIIK